jgi:hypothetical protein
LTWRDTLELSQRDAERLRAIRAAVEDELRLLDELLSLASSPALKRTIAMARRDVADIEPNLLQHVAERPRPQHVAHRSRSSAWREASAARTLAQDTPNVTQVD